MGSKWGICAAWIAVLLAGCGEDGNTVTYTMPSESMEPNFSVEEKVEVDLDAYAEGAPEIGDAIVFHPPMGADRGSECGVRKPPRQACPEPVPRLSDQLFLKRVVALPGDELTIDDGRPVVNGKLLLADTIQRCGGVSVCSMPQPITIPPGHYFVLGDNSGASDDSRFWGPVPLEAIEGRVEE